eukprot:SAG31_NODE_1707_length_7484_cov_8.798104_4_plen_174_part_00
MNGADRIEAPVAATIPTSPSWPGRKEMASRMPNFGMRLKPTPRDMTVNQRCEPQQSPRSTEQNSLQRAVFCAPRTDQPRPQTRHRRRDWRLDEDLVGLTHCHSGIDGFAVEVFGILLYELPVGGHGVVPDGLYRAAAHIGAESLELRQAVRLDLEVLGRSEDARHPGQWRWLS